MQKIKTTSGGRVDRNDLILYNGPPAIVVTVAIQKRCKYNTFYNSMSLLMVTNDQLNWNLKEAWTKHNMISEKKMGTENVVIT